MPKSDCPEKTRLQKAVADSLTAFYAARFRYDRAAKLKRDTTEHTRAMEKAKEVEREAIQALEKHELEHGC